RFADWSEWTVFVLLLGETVGIGSVWRVHGLLPQVRMIVLQPGFVRSRLRDHERRDVPRFLCRELRIEVVGAMRHVEMNEIGSRDEPRHSSSIIEAVPAP